MSAVQFVANARALKGARWRHRGRKPWAVDCIGLIVLSCAGTGLDPMDLTNYGREPWEDQLRKGLQARFGMPVDNMGIGDIALIRYLPGEPSHVGIIGDHPTAKHSLIHAHNLHGVVEHALSGPYLVWIEEVYRPWPVKSSR